MLSYRHAFHAGNHADVLKHFVLLMLARAMQRKDTPFCYLDTHAGAGGYDLTSEYAQKNAEFDTGIGKLWELAETPEEVADYLAAVRAFNGTGPLTRYPGSPWFVHHLLREHDRMVLCELHSNELPLLKQRFAGDKRVQIHSQDGFHGLKAFVPPKEKRLLTLIDPPYELDKEYRSVNDGLTAAYKRMATGIYAIWYPMLERRDTEGFMKGLQQTGIRKMLRVELCVRGDRTSRGMKGSGMVIVNPPWQLDSKLEALLPWLWTTLSTDSASSYKLEWLVPE